MEHALGTLGVALAAAAGLFAATMVAKGERQLAWAPITPYITTLLGFRSRTPAAGTAVDADLIVTGSIDPPGHSRVEAARGMRDGLRGYELIGVEGGVAVVRNRDGYQAVQPGTVLPGGGHVLSIERAGSSWEVITDLGTIREAEERAPNPR